MDQFEPKIVAFLCNWCAYAGADLAGVSRLQYPDNLRPVRVMCSGRVDPVFILDAMLDGADGVLVSGWHIGDCHYLDGNVEAEKKIALTQHLLDHAGIGAQRLHLAWVSSAEAQRFAQVATTVVEDVRQVGPLDRASLALHLEAVRRTLDSEFVRWTVGKQRRITRDGDVYGRKWNEDTFVQALQRITDTEYEKDLIYTALKHGNTSVREVNRATGLPLARISHHLADLERTGQVEFKRMVEHKPEFAAV